MGNDVTSLVVLCLVIAGFLLLVHCLYNHSLKYRQNTGKNYFFVRLLVAAVILFFVAKPDKSRGGGPWNLEQEREKMVMVPERFLSHETWMDPFDKIAEKKYKSDSAEFYELVGRSFDKMLVIYTHEMPTDRYTVETVDYMLNKTMENSPFPPVKDIDVPLNFTLSSILSPDDYKLVLNTNISGVQGELVKPYWIKFPIRFKKNKEEDRKILFDFSSKQHATTGIGSRTFFIPYSSSEKLVELSVSQLVDYMYPEFKLKCTSYNGKITENYFTGSAAVFKKLYKQMISLLIILVVLTITYKLRRVVLNVPVGLMYIFLIMMGLIILHDYYNLQKNMGYFINQEFFSDRSCELYKLTNGTEYFKPLLRKKYRELEAETDSWENRYILNFYSKLLENNFHYQCDVRSRSIDKYGILDNYYFWLGDTKVNFYLFREETCIVRYTENGYKSYYSVSYQDIIAQIITRKIRDGEKSTNWIASTKNLAVKPIAHEYNKRSDKTELIKALREFDESFRKEVKYGE